MFCDLKCESTCVSTQNSNRSITTLISHLCRFSVIFLNFLAPDSISRTSMSMKHSEVRVADLLEQAENNVTATSGQKQVSLVKHIMLRRRGIVKVVC